MRSLYKLKTESKFRGLLSFFEFGETGALLPKKRQLFEMIYLFIFNKLPPNYYKDAGFQSNAIPWETKKLYLNSKQYFKIAWKLNSWDYRKLSQNKMAEKAMFTLYNIPAPKYLGLLDENNGRTPEGEHLRSVNDLETYLKGRIGTRVCFKLLEGWGGKGFQVVDVLKEDNKIILHPLNHSPVTVNYFCRNELRYSKDISYLLEEYFVQHRVLNKINPSSVNTIRLWVVSRPGKESTRVIGAFLRIGRQGSLVDNIDSGGLLCNVDLETGILDSGENRFDKRMQYDSHPATGVRIKNERIPFWKEIKTLACKALTTFPNINFAGIDMAVGDKGPVVIEMNVPPDPSGGVRFGYCRRDLLSDSPW